MAYIWLIYALYMAYIWLIPPSGEQELGPDSYRDGEQGVGGENRY